MAATTLDATFYGHFQSRRRPHSGRLQTSMVWPWIPAIRPTLCCIALTITAARGILANGMWFQTCQGSPWSRPPGPGLTSLNCPTPPATAAPGAPQNVFGVASNNAVTVNWSPAQSNQPVTSYTVTTVTAGPGCCSTVSPLLQLLDPTFPPTSVLISGLVNGTVIYLYCNGNKRVRNQPCIRLPALRLRLRASLFPLLPQA